MVLVEHDSVSGRNRGGQPFELLLVGDFFHIRELGTEDFRKGKFWDGKQM